MSVKVIMEVVKMIVPIQSAAIYVIVKMDTTLTLMLTAAMVGRLLKGNPEILIKQWTMCCNCFLQTLMNVVITMEDVRIPALILTVAITVIVKVDTV